MDESVVEGKTQSEAWRTRNRW